MSQAVVDSSVVVKWLVKEPGSEEADAFLFDCLAHRVRLIAPGSMGPEIGNALWTRFHRGLASEAETLTALDGFRRFPIILTASATLLEDAMSLALEHHRSFYDCLFLALSLREQCEFVTADAKLAHSVSGQLSNIRLIAASS